jgi:hypothetical protein
MDLLIAAGCIDFREKVCEVMRTTGFSMAISTAAAPCAFSFILASVLGLFRLFSMNARRFISY